MSSALAMAGVSAVLQYYLTNLYTPLTALFGGTVKVSAKAPDMVQETFTAGSPENQVNLSCTRSPTMWDGAIRISRRSARTA